jgi:large subunit ribosomal protein L10
MNRTEKTESVEALREKFLKAKAAFVTEYRGMTVDKLFDLRKKVRAAEGELKVVKNRLAKIALKGSAYEGLLNEFKGPVAVALSYKDAGGIAKALSESVSETSPFKIRVASLGGASALIDEAGIKALSKLPSREVLLSMMLSAIRAPVQNFANVIAATPRNLANVLTAVKDQKAKQA